MTVANELNKESKTTEAVWVVKERKTVIACEATHAGGCACGDFLFPDADEGVVRQDWGEGSVDW